MRVLLLNQVFWPDRAGSARLLTDLARYLGAQGTDVTVIAGHTTCVIETQAAPPVRIVRTPNLKIGKGLAGRGLSFVAYLAVALAHCIFGPKPDIVVTLTTPPLLSMVGVLTKKLRRCRHFIWEMDLYPELAVDVHILRRNCWAVRVLAFLATAARRRADGVIVIGECMRERLETDGLPAEKLLLAENWADGALLEEMPLPVNGPITVIYAGNLGRVHDTETIAHAMHGMRTDARIRFRFVGGGVARPQLEEFCRERRIVNAEFLGYQKSDALPGLLAQSHLGLVSLRSECLGSSVPSKMYEYMAAGRPLIYIGPPQSTVARTIDRYGCGWHISPGDITGLVVILRQLLDDPERVRRAGANARRVFLSRYDLPQGVSQIARILGVPQAQLST